MTGEVPSDDQSGRNERIWLKRFAQLLLQRGGIVRLPADDDDGIDLENDRISSSLNGDRVIFSLQRKSK